MLSHVSALKVHDRALKVQPVCRLSAALLHNMHKNGRTSSEDYRQAIRNGVKSGKCISSNWPVLHFSFSINVLAIFRYIYLLALYLDLSLYDC